MRHVSRTHSVNLDLLCDRINLNPMIQIKYVGTTQQLADIHTKKGSFTGDRWTQLTQLLNIMTRTTFTQCNLSVSSTVVILFYKLSTRAGDSVAASASVKQKPVRCTGLIARTVIDKYADMWTITQYFHQNIKLEATPSVKTCVSKILKEWTTRRQEHQAPVNWKRLEHQAPVAAEDLSSEKKVHLHPNTDGENYISKFDHPANNFKPHSTERVRISQSSIEQFMCKIGWISYQSSIFPAQRCDLESIYERLFMAFTLAYQGWTNVSQEHKIWHSPCNDK